MGILAVLYGRQETLSHKDKIILLNGRKLDCYPPATGEVTEVTSAEEQNLFINNAFYLLAHKERIMSDSRMFMCPVAIKNGLAYTGTSGFTHPTLGIYIEWWLNCPGAMQTDKKGNRLLVYHLAGSPLSGANHCMAVCENGQRKEITLSPFKNHWKPFMEINQRYTEAKNRCAAYTLQQVLDILEQESAGKIDYNWIIENDFLKKEIKVLSEKVENLKEESKHWYNKYAEVLIRYNKKKIRTVYAKYQDLEQKTNKEIALLRAQKKELKAALKSGLIDGIHYQRQLTPIKKQIGDLKCSLSVYKYECLCEMFPERDITINMIEQYINKINDKNGNNN